MSTLAERVEKRRSVLGLSQEALAERVGVSQQAIQKVESGETRQPKYMLRLAHELQSDPHWLETGVGAEPPPPTPPKNSDVDLRTARLAPEVDSRDRGLPIYASAEAGKDGMAYSIEPIDWVSMPGPLGNVRGGFGVYVVGDSMEPRYEHGELILIHPTKPPRIGDDVLLGKREDGQTKAMVKRLVGRDGARWRLKQYNPPRDFWVRRADWPQVMVIVGKYSRG